MAFLRFIWALWIGAVFSQVSARVLMRAQQKNNTHFDFVILGGGTAGLVVANRLSEDPSITVAVIEAGNLERNNPNVTSAVALGLAKDTAVDWQYATAPQIYGGNESIIWSAGKGLGGSSLINGTSLTFRLQLERCKC